MITAGLTSCGYASTMPAKVSQAPIFSKRLAARFKALWVKIVSTPRSKRPLASLRRPKARLVRRMLGPWKEAASKITFFVSLVTSVKRPPITPPKPAAFSASPMVIMEGFRMRSLSSKVMSFSPSSARRTIRVRPATLSAS